MKYTKKELSLLKKHQKMISRRKEEKFFKEDVIELYKVCSFVETYENFVKFKIGEYVYDYYPGTEKLLKISKDKILKKDIWQKITPVDLLQNIKRVIRLKQSHIY
jgi:hypothetical protein